jgi:hypothetical protein
MCSRGDYRVLEPPKESLKDPNSTFIGQCLPCPEGTLCDEAGITVENLPLKKGYWRSSRNSSNVVLCYIEDACLQAEKSVEPSSSTTSSTDHQCRDGHTGPICNVCLDGYAKDVLGNCETCEGEGFHFPTETLIFLVIFVVVVAATVYYVVIRRRKKKEETSRVDRFRQRTRTLSQAQSNETASSSLQAVQMDQDHWFNRGRTKAKIMVSFLQILTSYESVLEVRFPPVFEKFSRWLSSTANLDALQVMRADCIVDTNFYSTLLVQTLLPLLISTLIFITFVFFKTLFGKTKQKRAEYRDSATSAFLSLTFIVFASVSTTIFDTFNCIQIGDDPTQWLARDHSIDCESPVDCYRRVT